MATVKYTGARYLLKFVDEWTENTVYEPLIALRYNDASYISKRPIPASIGSPDNNPEYWAYWGSGDVAFEQLRELVLSYDERINDIDEEIVSLQNKKDIFSAQKIEMAKCVFRELEFGVNIDSTEGAVTLQGGCVFPFNAPKYYAYITGQDNSRVLKIAELDTMNILANMSLANGHYGSISYKDGRIYIGNYTQGTDTYGTLYIVNVTLPQNPYIENTYQFPTTINPNGVASYNENNCILIEGNSTNGNSKYSGIYKYNYDNDTLTHLFNINRFENGARPQPISYDSILDAVVSHTTEKACATYYDMQGNKITSISFNSEYNFITLGEIENITPIGNKIYFGAIDVMKGKCGTSKHLFEADLSNPTGVGTAMFPINNNSRIQITISSTGNLIPNFGDITDAKSNWVIYPKDAFNYARYINKCGFGLPTVRNQNETYEYMLSVFDVKCELNLLNGYFKQGVFICNSDIVFNELRTVQWQQADTGYQDLNSLTMERFDAEGIPSKPSYILAVSSKLHFATVGSYSTNMQNAYTIRALKSIITFAYANSFSNMLLQRTNADLASCQLEYSDIENSVIKCGAINSSNCNFTGDVSFKGNILGIHSANAVIPIVLAPLNTETVTLVQDGVRVASFIKPIGASFAFKFNDENFEITRDNTGITMPNNSNYQYMLAYV